MEILREFLLGQGHQSFVGQLQRLLELALDQEPLPLPLRGHIGENGQMVQDQLIGIAHPAKPPQCFMKHSGHHAPDLSTDQVQPNQEYDPIVS